MTQASFAKLLERKDFAGLEQENGRFRAFLLASMKHFLANERDRAGRVKRGGNITHFSLDWQRVQIANSSLRMKGRCRRMRVMIVSGR